ncbi:MAG: C2H2-type zinc finger protein [Nitrososphaerales archaeon]
MISIECDGLRDLMAELAAYISENVHAVSAIKTSSIVLDPLTKNGLDANEVGVHVEAFLARKDLSNDFLVEVSGEKITIVSVSGRKVKVEKIDSGLLVCPHCGKVTPYEEEMNIHVRTHYLI